MSNVTRYEQECVDCGGREHRFYLRSDKSKGAYPSVTTVLDWAFREYDGMNQSMLRYAAERSTQVHKACALLTGCKPGKTVNRDSLDGEVGSRVEAFERWAKDGHWRFTHAELPVFSKRGFAGTTDLVAENKDGRAIVDIKCTAMEKRTASLQLAAYSLAYGETMDDWRSRRRIVLYLNPEKYASSGGYKAVFCERLGDIEIFEAALRLFNWWHR